MGSIELKDAYPKLLTREELPDYERKLLYVELRSLEEIPEYRKKFFYVKSRVGELWPLVQIGKVADRVIFWDAHYWNYAFPTAVYGTVWRCWTEEPTKEQMEETKWEAS